MTNTPQQKHGNTTHIQMAVISDKQIEILSKRLLPEIKKFFANEDVRMEFEEWKKLLNKNL